MENNKYVNNETSIEGMTGKLDSSLGSLADHMQVLSLGAPSTFEQKKFNVHAWSTPLKSIENLPQQQKCGSVCGGRTDKMDANATLSEAKLEEDDVAGDSLTNVTDLLPDQNLFEKTSDFIEYCLMFPTASNGSSVCDTTAAATSPLQSSIRSSMLLDPPADSCSSLSVSRKEEVVTERPLKGDCSSGSDINSQVMSPCQNPFLNDNTDSLVLHVSENSHSCSKSVKLPSYMAQTPGHLPWPQYLEGSEKWPITECSDSGDGNDNCICNEHGADSDTDSTLSENTKGSVDPFARCDSHNRVAVNDESSLVHSLTTDFHAYLAIDHVTSPSSELSCGNAPEGGSEMQYDEAVEVVPDDPSSVECEEMNGGVELICECDSGDDVDHLTGHTDGNQEEVVSETNVIVELDSAYDTVVGFLSPPNGELNLGISRLSLSSSNCATQIDHLPMSNELEKSSVSVIIDKNDELEPLAETSPSGQLNMEGEDFLGAEVNAERKSHDDELSVASALAHMSHNLASGATFVEEPNRISLRDDEETEIVQPESIVEYLTVGDATPLVDNCQTSLHDDSTEDACHIQEMDSPGGAFNVSAGSAMDAESAERVVMEHSVCSWMDTDDDGNDESCSTCDEREFTSAPSSVSSLQSSEDVDDAAEFANEVSVQSAVSLVVDVGGLSVTTPPSNTDARNCMATISSILTPPTSEADSSPGGPSDDVETFAEKAAVIAEAADVHAKVVSLTGASPSNEFAVDACHDSLDDVLEVASTKSDDCYEDCVDNLPALFAIQCTTVEEDSKTILPQDSKYERSFMNDNSKIKESERSIDSQVEKKCDLPKKQSLNVVPTDDAIIASTSAQRSPSKRDDFSSALPSTPLSSFCGRRTSVAVADDCAEVSDPFRAAASASAVSAGEPVARVQSEKLVSLLSTPASNVDQQRGQDSQTDKLSRVCDSMNRLISLCTPMKNARTQSRIPVNPFKCENVGNESQKIVFDFPTNLLDVSIGMLENMTALIAPAKPASSSPFSSDQNVASDLVSVAETPKDVCTQSNQTFSSPNRLNVSGINIRLLEENANLKNDIEEYKRKYEILQDEYESLRKTAFALHANENTLKKALEEREEEIRESTNKFLLLKECTNELIMSRNKVLDQYEEELRSKEEELRKLKASL